MCPTCIIHRIILYIINLVTCLCGKKDELLICSVRSFLHSLIACLGLIIFLGSSDANFSSDSLRVFWIVTPCCSLRFRNNVSPAAARCVSTQCSVARRSLTCLDTVRCRDQLLGVSRHSEVSREDPWCVSTQ